MSRLKVQGDGKPRLMLLRHSRPQPDHVLKEDHKPCCLEEEMEVYVWPKETRGGADKNKKENPVEKDNHACDAMRYAAADVDSLGHPEFLFA
jgi:phage terminase large subunit